MAIIEAIQRGITTTLLSSTGVTGTISGATFATIPSWKQNLIWQTKFGVSPASNTILLEGSIDGGTTFVTLDTSTSTIGEARTITTISPHIRTRVSASGTTGSTLSVAVNIGIS